MGRAPVDQTHRCSWATSLPAPHAPAQSGTPPREITELPDLSLALNNKLVNSQILESVAEFNSLPLVALGQTVYLSGPQCPA